MGHRVDTKPLHGNAVFTSCLPSGGWRRARSRSRHTDRRSLKLSALSGQRARLGDLTTLRPFNAKAAEPSAADAPPRYRRAAGWRERASIGRAEVDEGRCKVGARPWPSEGHIAA